MKSRKENNTAGTVKRELDGELKVRHEEPEGIPRRVPLVGVVNTGLTGKRVKPEAALAPESARPETTMMYFLARVPGLTVTTWVFCASSAERTQKRRSAGRIFEAENIARVRQVKWDNRRIGQTALQGNGKEQKRGKHGNGEY